MKICRNCGHEMNDDELFCCECGTKAEEQETAAEVTQETEGEKDEETEAIEKALDAAVEEEQTTAEEETLIGDQTRRKKNMCRPNWMNRYSARTAA